MTRPHTNLLRGTVDLMILAALRSEPLHGYGVSEWIDRSTDGDVLMEEGTLYPALHRLEGKGWIEAAWGLSENNRRAKYYALTRSGRARLDREEEVWNHFSAAVSRLLAREGGAE